MERDRSTSAKVLYVFDQTSLILGREAQIPLWISRRLAEEVLSYRPVESIGIPYVVSSAPIE